ncbi:MAG: RraA family protein [Armatimonadetes bacterium]|nr:RraA family protein [Armatimonadota bacterium]
MPDKDMALLERLDRLYPAVVADILDRVGYRNQVMRHDIRPLYPEARMVGYAFPVLTAEIYHMPDQPYKMELEAVDALSEGDIMVVSKVDHSFWGELLSTAARFRGARGIVVDGFGRDTLPIIEMRFPCFLRGIHVADSLGRLDVMAYNVPVDCGDVRVNPRDLLIADFDGIVTIPHEAAEEVISKAEEKVSGENLVRKHLAEGMPVSEAFKRFGVI